jgi:hypothetical protein
VEEQEQEQGESASESKGGSAMGGGARAGAVFANLPGSTQVFGPKETTPTTECCPCSFLNVRGPVKMQNFMSFHFSDDKAKP